MYKELEIEKWDLSEKSTGKKTLFSIREDRMIFEPRKSPSYEISIYKLSNVTIDVTTFALRYVLILTFDDGEVRSYYTGEALKIKKKLIEATHKYRPPQIIKLKKRVKVLSEILRSHELFLSDEERQKLHVAGLCISTLSACERCSD